MSLFPGIATFPKATNQFPQSAGAGYGAAVGGWKTIGSALNDAAEGTATGDWVVSAVVVSQMVPTGGAVGGWTASAVIADKKVPVGLGVAGWVITAKTYGPLLDTYYLGDIPVTLRLGDKVARLARGDGV